MADRFHIHPKGYTSKYAMLFSWILGHSRISGVLRLHNLSMLVETCNAYQGPVEA
jgi:hypothetical protein